MRTKILLTVTTALLIFTISAFALVILNSKIIILPFAVLGLILMIVFFRKLNKVN